MDHLHTQPSSQTSHTPLVRFTIPLKLFTLIAVSAVVIVVAMGVELMELRSRMWADRQDLIRSQVENAVSVLAGYQERVEAGELTLEEAQAEAGEVMRTIRYGNDDYMFVYLPDGTRVKFPEKKGEGENFWDMTDSAGTFLIQDLVAAAQSGGGFTNYRFPRLGSETADPKLAYSEIFAPWDWIVGTGVYIDDLDAAFQAEVLKSLAWLGGVLVLLIGVAVPIARSLTKPIAGITSNMKEIAEGNLDVEIAGAGRNDEIGDMAKAVEVFKQNGKQVKQMGAAEVEAEERRQHERAQMMQELQTAFGEVVDAAIAGDFTRRVDVEFPDAELNALAGSVNSLVDTVDRGIGETGEVLAALAETDLTKRVNGTYQGAFDKLKSDTNLVADKLTQIVGQIKETSRGLKVATGEILSGANDLSERTTKQAATIEETSAAMEQLAQTVGDNASRAEEASQKSRAVSDTAEEGGQVMSQANQAMERITQSSAKISNIIGMIDDIAFQTNLLALNASVEAARAGEAGKGFAVVAVEVRRLAQSAAQASSEVKVLIEQSGEEVAGGSRLVADAAEKLEVMLGAVKENNILMEGIARESREQAGAIDEVNVAVRQMDEMTQHNAALVEETNAAIEQTEAQASELDRIVEVFTLQDAGSARPATSSSQPAPAQKQSGIKGLQNKVASAAKAYLSKGNTALNADTDWSEF